MKADFSRDTFDKKRHFSRVLMQQGRVQVDADWNEQVASLLHYIRTLAADLIGPFAGPAGDDYGFGITLTNPVSHDFTIGKGRYYVDGILCENDSDTSYLAQKDFPGAPNPISAASQQHYLVYLDVWERHITALEDDYIREKALGLGGPDTATRAKVVWQVKVQDPTKLAEPTCAQIKDKWLDFVEVWQPAHRGCLKARVKPSDDYNEPCLTAPDARYRGQENQLYRVEIHEGGPAASATFKWSRDNASIVTACLELKGKELTVENAREFAAGQWVELSDDGRELRGEPGTLVRLVNVDGNTLYLDTAPAANDVTKVRRWDQSETRNGPLKDGAVPITEGEWIDLENGIQVQFTPATAQGAHQYRNGDYWQAPARVALADIEWPGEPEGPLAVPPDGIVHHYAPLAILQWNGSWSVLDDGCRCKLSAMNSCNIPSYGEEGMGGASSC